MDGCKLSVDPPELFKNKIHTIAGVGLTMDGINQNVVVYDLLTELGWRDETPDVEKWVQEYAARR